MMNGNGSFLCIYACTEHTCRTKQHTDCTVVHSLDKCLALLVVFCFLYKADLICRNAVVFHELAFDFGVDIPFVRLVCSQIRENELCSFLCVEFVVILGNIIGTMRSLIVGVVLVMGAYHSHIQ